MDTCIGFVGGGNMAAALVRGLLASGRVAPAAVRVSDPSEARRSALARDHGIQTEESNAAVARFATVVVLAVKPGFVAAALGSIAGALAPGTLVISIAAGVPLAALEGLLPAGTHVVRAMPNTAATALAGATAFAAGSHATREDLEQARELFESVGTAVVVDEALLDAVTGLAGSGPAYVMLVIEALADGGVKMGLPREAALALAAQTVYGSAKLLLETKEHPARLKDMVTSPGGTTIAGLHALESGGLRAALMDAVERATLRSRELGALTLGRMKKP
ncbi:MAG TPA: pyrroline-5-carboxylate reductase [Polyangiaceae bacterium]|jgi:pyrroline-5-carboxylate reductase|nr:pyrroline-5-carboxylate reductase [Polyangiaceae bacterium]